MSFRNFLPFILFGAFAASVAQAGPCAPGPAGLAGMYVLEGEMEVGSQLLLQPDGQFAFMLAYGAIDQEGRGCWSVADGILSLKERGRSRVPAQHSPADRAFNGMRLIVEPDGRLRWPLPGFRGAYTRVRD